VAKEIGCSQGKIQKIEAGTAPITREELDKVIALCRIPAKDADGLRGLAAQDLRNRRRVARAPDWPAFGQLSDLEKDASEIRCLHGDRIPGTLQSEHYMLQVMTEVFGEIDVTNLIKHRLQRARILFEENGPRYRVILSESSVHRTLRGKPDILVDQLEHLLTLVRTSARLELHILPFEANVLFMDSDFQVLRFADPALKDFAYIESSGGAHTFRAPKDLARFDRHWDVLHTAALSPAESEALLAKLVNSKTSNLDPTPRD
jgi:Domain of unknown function (DUF5753)